MGEHMPGHGDMHTGMTTEMGHTMPDHHTMDHSMHPTGHGTHPPGHGDGGEHDMMMMQMYFYLSTNVTILFKEWEVNTTGGLAGSCIAVFFLAMLYEGLKVLRETLLRRSAVNVRFHSMQMSKESETMLTETHGAGQTKFMSWGHLVQTFLHIIQVTVSYFLMLIFMTYNGWLCICVVLGAGAGYLIFGWKKAIVVDINEHCH
ncbi:high affinity copper uptake protein 1-like [Amphiura filiformis]|uniref:high affinity copper uptake protein 1-like n=1 Tax=Amphiura filiformis TaxID=82378 RepID=UPI003B20D098